MSRSLVIRGLSGIVALASVALGAHALLSGSSQYIVRAEFANVDGLRPQYTVRIAGANVGSVTKETLERDGRVIVEMAIDRAAGPIGLDATAAIRPSNLLGEKYVSLEPGNTARPAPSGTLIPLGRTATPTELDDVLDVLDGPTRSALGTFFSEQGRSLAGRGQDFAATLASLPPALDHAEQLVAGLAQDNQAIARLIDESDRILVAVAPQRRALGRLVQNAGGMLATLADERSNLGETIRRAPAAFRQVYRSLVVLGQAAVPMAPAADGLRVSAPPLTATLQELPSFAAAAKPALETALAVAPTLKRLGVKASPVVFRLQPFATKLQQFATQLGPASGVLDRAAPDLLGALEAWARVIRTKDAAGHYILGGAIVPGPAQLIGLPGIQSFILGSTSQDRHAGRGHGVLSGLPVKGGSLNSKLEGIVKHALAPLHLPAQPPVPPPTLGSLLNYLIKP